MIRTLKLEKIKNRKRRLEIIATMVASCSICGEQYGVTEDVTFHKFPANEERRKKWLAAVQRGPTWTPGKRSMLCSNHFSRDKFVHKISGDKIRRYLMPDTVPTIFDRTRGKLKIAESQQLDASNEASSSNYNASANTDSMEIESVQYPDKDNPTGSLNLEILAATSVALDSSSISIEPRSINVGKNTANTISEPIGIPVSSMIPIPGSSANSFAINSENTEIRVSNNPGGSKTSQRAVEIQTDLTFTPKRNRQVYPGDFKRLNYNDGTEVRKSWTVLDNSIKKMRSSMKVLRQRNRRLEKRVTDLKEVVKFLKNRIVAKDSAAVRSFGDPGFPVTRKASPKGNRVNRLSDHLKDHDYVSWKK